MSLKLVKAWLMGYPFKPFELVTSDGAVHRVEHSELASLEPGGTLLLYHPSYPDEPEPLPIAMALLHVTTLRAIDDALAQPA